MARIGPARAQIGPALTRPRPCFGNFGENRQASPEIEWESFRNDDDPCRAGTSTSRQNRSTSTQTLSNPGQICRSPYRIWPKPVEVCPTLLEIGPSSLDSALNSVEPYHPSARSRPGLVATPPDLDEVGRCLPSIGQTWPRFGRARTKFGRYQKSPPISEFRRHRGWPRLGRIWPDCPTPASAPCAATAGVRKTEYRPKPSPERSKNWLIEHRAAPKFDSL